ncbi:MAG: hypothetical protein GQ540_03460 [Lutibacter sp.]|uniref:hypothetical protein n=1 Tax=Lutibacter sp. TaxID=1925666 RepID=UPI0019F97363|nr:hypothetical protein [Lutibacter sp.]NOR27570.1 hypothetical protein [Lutibacter sp.]
MTKKQTIKIKTTLNKKSLQAQKDFYAYQCENNGLNTDFLEVDKMLDNDTNKISPLTCLVN